MNREKDFHKKDDGSVINSNTRDYRRAKNRRKVLAAAKEAFGDDGQLVKVTEKVEEFTTQPSRADQRVTVLEAELAATKESHDEMKAKLDAALEDNANIKQRLEDTIAQNEEIKDNVYIGFEVKNELNALKAKIEELENK